MSYTLIEFIKKEDYFAVSKILRKTGNLDINYKDEVYGCTPVHTVIIYCSDDNRSRFIDLLLEYKPDLNIKNGSSFTALHMCFIYSVSKEIIEKLMRNGANPNIKDKYEQTALHYAIINSRKDMFKSLMEYGCVIDDKARRLSVENRCSWELWKKECRNSYSRIQMFKKEVNEEMRQVDISEKIEREKEKKEEKERKRENSRRASQEKEERRRVEKERKRAEQDKRRREQERRKREKDEMRIRDQQRKLDEKRRKLENKEQRYKDYKENSSTNFVDSSKRGASLFTKFSSSGGKRKSDDETSKGSSSISSGIMVLPPDIVRERPRPNLRNLNHREPRATVI